MWSVLVGDLDLLDDLLAEWPLTESRSLIIAWIAETKRAPQPARERFLGAVRNRFKEHVASNVFPRHLPRLLLGFQGGRQWWPGEASVIVLAEMALWSAETAEENQLLLVEDALLRNGLFFDPPIWLSLIRQASYSERLQLIPTFWRMSRRSREEVGRKIPYGFFIRCAAHRYDAPLCAEMCEDWLLRAGRAQSRLEDLNLIYRYGLTTLANQPPFDDLRARIVAEYEKGVREVIAATRASPLSARPQLQSRIIDALRLTKNLSGLEEFWTEVVLVRLQNRRLVPISLVAVTAAELGANDLLGRVIEEFLKVARPLDQRGAAGDWAAMLQAAIASGSEPLCRRLVEAYEAIFDAIALPDRLHVGDQYRKMAQHFPQWTLVAELEKLRRCDVSQSTLGSWFDELANRRPVGEVSDTDPGRFGGAGRLLAGWLVNRYFWSRDKFQQHLADVVARLVAQPLDAPFPNRPLRSLHAIITRCQRPFYPCLMTEIEPKVRNFLADIRQLDDQTILRELQDGTFAKRVQPLVGLEFFEPFVAEEWPAAPEFAGIRAAGEILLENYAAYVKYGMRQSGVESAQLHHRTWQALEANPPAQEVWSRALSILIQQMHETCQTALAESLLAFTHNAKNHIEDVITAGARHARTAEEQADFVNSAKEYIAAFERLLHRRPVGGEILADLRKHLRRTLELPFIGVIVPPAQYMMELPEDVVCWVKTREGLPRDALSFLLLEIGYNCSEALRRLPESERHICLRLARGSGDEQRYWILTVENSCEDASMNKSGAGRGRTCMEYFATMIGAGVDCPGSVETRLLRPRLHSTRILLPFGREALEEEPADSEES